MLLPASPIDGLHQGERADVLNFAARILGRKLSVGDLRVFWIGRIEFSVELAAQPSARPRRTPIGRVDGLRVARYVCYSDS